MTYKAWRAQRERQGLSAEGGIAPQTNIVGTALLDSPPETPTNSPQLELPPQSSSHVAEPSDSAIQPVIAQPALTVPTEISSEKSPIQIDDADPSSVIPSCSKHRESTFSEPDDEDDHHPIPTELLATSGDNCAICIELLEDDDEVRGLTCGHCYHQTCLDPWLTQRRASCPLCKADYYIPKPPPENPEPTTNIATPDPTQPAGRDYWAPLFFRPFVRPAGDTQSAGARQLQPFIRRGRREGPTDHTMPINTAAGAGTAPATSAPSASRWTVTQGRIYNPFTRRTAQLNGSPSNSTTDANILERGDGTQTEGQSRIGN